jgi:putative intracellular protease/amidase
VTGFTNAEEDIMQLSSAMPFMLEDALIKAGANLVKADEPWGEKFVTDGLTITSQNPASAGGVGKAIAKALGE